MQYNHIVSIIIRPHRSTTYVDAAYCYRPISVVWWSATVVSPAKMVEPIEMPFGLRTQVGPCNNVLDGVQIPHGEGQFWRGGERRPIVKYKDTLQWAVQKRLNRSRCCFRFGLEWAQFQGSMHYVRVQFGATRHISLNLSRAAAMRPLVKLLWSLAINR